MISHEKNDSERLNKKGIKSPDHAKMKYTYFDKQKRITFFFKTEAKYRAFLRKIDEADSI